VLLKALHQLALKGESFEMLLVGDGPQKPHLERLASELGLSSYVRFVGAVDDVPSLLATAHLLVHPSRSEGLSNTILEAMAEGLPVVATDVGGTSEIISDGVTGLLVPPDEPAMLADRIHQLLVSPALRQKLGSAALALVRERCTVSAVTAQYARIYDSVAA
jgi:glycosyltransferase involved in cell wall biosynthesis